MDFTRFDQARVLIDRARAKEISLREFDNSLINLVWDVEQDQDPNTLNLVGPILLVIAEFDLGHRSEPEVFATIEEQVRNVTLRWPHTGRAFAYGASGRVITEQLDGPQFVFGQPRVVGLASAPA